ncbi:LexA/Signal peptidase [Fomitiporia mediterranea MF3/22]|uniref:LexA/Signal peptidase n=1 Tax=Fomitiporia mediterranea (strain MF3/22) TaxID=694068 RepID=UPI00044093A8|nr:LexA/Signal peptidase [Fomitiporia mediterranea MF3/22]EJD01443.1 LexA/Signal peptidase [Fomitiporia mediterranea MF3/22]
MPFRIPRSVWKAITWAPVPFIFVQHCMTVKQISGRSMQPTLNPEPCIWKDIVLFNRFSVHAAHDVRRGDVVSLRSPVKPNETVVKRVVALPGDTVQTLPPYPQKEVKIPEGYCWVEGDEPFWTLDSNTWGPVPQALIDAKLVYILWPLNRFGSLKPRALRDTRTPRNANGSDPAWKRQIASIERDKWAHEPTNGKT